VISILMVNKGIADKLSVPQIRPFEAYLHSYLEANSRDLLDTIRQKKEIDKDLEEKLTKVFQHCQAEFLAGAKAAAGGSNGNKPRGGTSASQGKSAQQSA